MTATWHKVQAGGGEWECGPYLARQVGRGARAWLVLRYDSAHVAESIGHARTLGAAKDVAQRHYDDTHPVICTLCGGRLYRQLSLTGIDTWEHYLTAPDPHRPVPSTTPKEHTP